MTQGGTKEKKRAISKYYFKSGNRGLIQALRKGETGKGKGDAEKKNNTVESKPLTARGGFMCINQ